MDNAPAGTQLNVLVGRDGRTTVLTVVAETAPAVPAAPALSAQAAEQIGRKLYEAGFFLRVATSCWISRTTGLRLASAWRGAGAACGGPPEIGTAPPDERGCGDELPGRRRAAGAGDRGGVSLPIFRWAFMAQDLEYALAYSTYVALNQLSLSASPYAKLGPSMMLYSTASSLIAKYYSLGAAWARVGRSRA